MHHRLTISDHLAAKQENWYQLIRLFLSSLGQFGLPAMVFGAPTATSRRLDLFILENGGRGVTQYSAQERSVLNQMLGIRLSMCFSSPKSLSQTISRCPSCLSTEEDYKAYLTNSIYTSLLTQKPETIHALQFCLSKRCNIEIRFQYTDPYFHDVSLRYNKLSWIQLGNLGISCQSLRLLLEFNRTFKQDTIGERINRSLFI
ncbi:hypothetical protein GCM10028807_00260 [Spirosoma daeguense]